MRLHGFGSSLRYDSVVQDPVACILTPLFIQISKRFSSWPVMHVWLLCVVGVGVGIGVRLIVWLRGWLYEIKLLRMALGLFFMHNSRIFLTQLTC